MFKRQSAGSPGEYVERSGFTPRQIIQLVLVVGLLVVAMPVGVQAAASLVTIKDPSTAAKARVDSATSALRVGGITNKLLDQTATNGGTTGTWTFTVPSSAYSQIRVFAESPGCAGFCDTLTINCVEDAARTCNLVSGQSFDLNGYNALWAVPGRTLRVTVDRQSGIGSWHVVIFGRTP